MLAHKVDVIARALALHRPDPADPIGVLAAVGGLEHAALAGFMLGAAALRIPVVLDGVIAGAAALVAAALAPDAVGRVIAGHRSAEPGATRALAHLGLRPLVDLDLRLGEGSGAALALPPRAERGTHPARRRHLRQRRGHRQGRSVTEASGRRVLVLGGARSGKSAHAEALLHGEDAVDYVATAAHDPADAEWAERIARHRERRPPHWRTIETTDLAGVLAAGPPPSWSTASPPGWSRDGHRRRLGGHGRGPREDWPARSTGPSGHGRPPSRQVIAVSDEVGSGIVPDAASARLFRDALGLLNQRLAASADEVWLVIAGIAERLR